jgi:hypothetical protein
MRFVSASVLFALCITANIGLARAVSAPAEHWADDEEGARIDVINLYVHGELAVVEDTFEKAGWVKASSNSWGVDVKVVGLFGAHEALSGLNHPIKKAEKLISKILDGKPEPRGIPDPTERGIDTEPVSIEYLNGEPQVAAYEKNTDLLKGRDHFRIFPTTMTDSEKQPIWAISASRDNKVTISVKNRSFLLFTHEPVPNEDIERDFVFASLTKIRAIEEVYKLKFMPASPDKINDAFSEDGIVYEVFLASPQTQASSLTSQTY